MNERSMRSLNLAFRFILELVALLSLFLWGFAASDQLLVQLILGVGAAALAIAVWGTFVSPKATRRIEDPARLVVEIVIFSAAALAFVASGQLVLGLLLGTAATISLVLMFAWGQRGL